MKMLPHRSSPVRAVFALLFGTLALAACKEVEIPGVYRIDIQQGNVITQEQLAALEAGMDKRKVRFILGTPLVTDAFNQQRWDYYYSLERRGEERVQRIISVFFEGDRLSSVSGDVRAAVGPIELPERVDKVVTVPDGYRDEGLFAALTPAFLSGKPKRQPRPEDQAQPEAAAADAAPEASPPAGTETAAPVTTAAAPSSTIDAEDERYLRELLADLGKDRAPPQPGASSSGIEPAATDNTGEEESIFSAWAKKLGWGESESSETDTPGTDSLPPLVDE